LVQNLNLKGASSTTVQPLPQAHPSIGKDSKDLHPMQENALVVAACVAV
jgi:hypothetical protein